MVEEISNCFRQNEHRIKQRSVNCFKIRSKHFETWDNWKHFLQPIPLQLKMHAGNFISRNRTIELHFVKRHTNFTKLNKIKIWLYSKVRKIIDIKKKKSLKHFITNKYIMNSLSAVTWFDMLKCLNILGSICNKHLFFIVKHSSVY